MIHFKSFCVTLFLTVFLLVPGTIWGATLNVPSTNYPTIQAAINAAGDGDLIEVAHGKYIGSLDIQIEGDGSSNTPTLTIHSNPGAIVKGAITVVNTTVDIDGIDVRKSRSAPDNGIVLIGAHHSTIQNSIIRNFREHGIYIEASDNVSVNNNGIAKCAIGIGCSDSENVTISQNSIIGNTDYGVFNYTTDLVDAADNWWGDVSGPEQGTGNAVGPNVSYTPWDQPVDEPTVLITSAYVTGFSYRNIIYKGEDVTYNIEYTIEGGSDYAKYRAFGKTLSKFSDFYKCDPAKETTRRKAYVEKGSHIMTLIKRVPKCADVMTKGISFAGIPFEMDGYYVDVRSRIKLKDIAGTIVGTDGWPEEAVFMVKRKP